MAAPLPDALTVVISPSDSEAMALAAIQRWIALACQNAGISVPTS